MLVERIIHFRTSIFPPLPNEAEELVNEGMYGKAVCQFLERELPQRGFEVIRYVAEDWGWWIEVENSVKSLELAIYSGGHDISEMDYAILLDIRKPSFFSLKKMKRVSRETEMKSLQSALEDLISSTPNVKLMSITEEFPF